MAAPVQGISKSRSTQTNFLKFRYSSWLFSCRGKRPTIYDNTSNSSFPFYHQLICWQAKYFLNVCYISGYVENCHENKVSLKIFPNCKSSLGIRSLDSVNNKKFTPDLKIYLDLRAEKKIVWYLKDNSGRKFPWDLVTKELHGERGLKTHICLEQEILLFLKLNYVKIPECFS